jgi:carboxymethylenebutenolidase
MRLFRSRASNETLNGLKGEDFMKQTTKIPAEAVELYTRFIHGEISRRAFVRGVERFAVTGLSAGAIIKALMPNYALGQQVRKDDERIKASYETVPSPNGNGYIRGYFVRPFSADTRTDTASKLPGVIVIHENRGLNPHTEDVARRFALENFNAFAPDALSSVGGYPGDDFKGGQLFAKIDPAKRTQDFIAAAQWLKSRPDSNGKICATGFCFGGSLANNLATLLGPDLAAAAPFYGSAPKAEDVPKIKGAILIHHGALDKNLVEAYPAQEAELKKNNIKYEGHIYPNSVHGFFNDATPERYNKITAPQAWARTLEWFNQFARA